MVKISYESVIRQKFSGCLKPRSHKWATLYKGPPVIAPHKGKFLKFALDRMRFFEKMTILFLVNKH